MRLIYDAFLNDKNMSTENINIFISLENNYPKSQRALQQTLQQLYNSVGLCICAHFPFFYFDQFFSFQSFFIWPIMNLFQKCFHDLFNSYLGWIVSPYLRTKVQGFSGDTTIVIHEIYFIEQYIFFVCLFWALPLLLCYFLITKMCDHQGRGMSFHLKQFFICTFLKFLQ